MCNATQNSSVNLTIDTFTDVAVYSFHFTQRDRCGSSSEAVLTKIS
jgi:hypothetical protein